MSLREGTVIWGANNIYSLRLDDGTILEHLRIKGKVLQEIDDAHNPLAPGDRVALDEEEPGSPPRIVCRVSRINAVYRWNNKRSRLQTIAANVARLFVVTSSRSPRYRPRFVDRLLVMAELECIPATIILNKADLPLEEEHQRHILELEGIGYTVLRTIALPGLSREEQGIDAVRREQPRGTSVLFGQSGVGKSSLINSLVPDAAQQTGRISDRYDRGRQTTTLARQVLLVESDRDGAAEERIIYVDTPGIREYPLTQYEATEIAAGFREFLPFIPDCRMPSCTHLHEPGCAVRAAVEDGRIGPLRYGSYTRIVVDREEEMR